MIQKYSTSLHAAHINWRKLTLKKQNLSVVLLKYFYISNSKIIST